MPVSHLGLTVSHIPSSTSFYLAALQPLGYHYMGQQGESIGLGINEADLFLTQSLNGYVYNQIVCTFERLLTHNSARVSPTHIAFSANDRPTVRNCYAGALNAGGRPSGAPSYRNDDCSCFNAAVEDLDGNTIEFIFRDASASSCDKALPETSQYSQPAPTWQPDAARSVVNDDAQTTYSKTSRAKSRTQTAMDLASTASKSMKSAAPTPGITRSRTDPVIQTRGNGSKGPVGILLGAAAGAAVGYAIIQSERDGSRKEADFASSMRSKDSRSRSGYEDSDLSKNRSRTYSTTQSARSSRHPPRSTPRAIEAAPYDDPEIQQAISRYNSSHRPAPQRSRTYDNFEYAPTSINTGRGDRYSTKRSSTLPLDQPNYYLEGVRSVPASRYGSRRGSQEESSLKRHDSAVSVHSHRSRRLSDGGKRSSGSKVGSSKHSRRGSLYDSAVEVPMPPSYTAGGYTDVGEESDGLGDMQTVVPDDSISCVDFSSISSKKGKSSRHNSKRSETPSERTVRPSQQSGSKHDAISLPIRNRDDYYSNRGGKRSTATYV